MRSFHFRQRRNFFGLTACSLILIAPQIVVAGTNTAYGTNALKSSSDNYNSAFGYYSLYYNKTGANNTATGAQALFGNISGTNNTASGVNALYANTYGSANTAFGMSAIYSNTTGVGNTAMGVDALYSNTIGNINTAVGEGALYSNSTGGSNTAIGEGALNDNTTGSLNTAIGVEALFHNTTGRNNIAVGNDAGIFITTGSGNIDIGNDGDVGDTSTMRIGTSGAQTKTFIAGISGVTASGGVQVYINSAGQLGTLTSSERFKKEIKSIDSVDRLLQLRPVSFVYKEDDKNQIQYGLIAEEVAKVYPELVQYDEEGKPFTVYYHLLTPLLLSELQKEHALNETRQEMLIAAKGKLDAQQTDLAYLKQQLIDQRAEMLAMMQQQKQQIADMTLLKRQLAQVNELLQAKTDNSTASSDVALVISR